MSLYAVKNNEGKYWDFEDPGFWKEAFCSKLYTLSENEAQDVAHDYGGHVVELLEAPAKVVVSEEEAEMLEGAKKQHNPAWYIGINVDGRPGTEDRLMRAYVNGWTVEKPKRFNVKVPKKWSGDDKHYWTKEQDGALTWAYLINNDYMIPAQQFTAAEIEHYGLGDCEKVVVTDSAKTTEEEDYD
ncbi:DUF1642 domain-containing protein [Lacticaseibacillus suilingensis]|uniref:DUF1642 domain-containing protein n=1 Tax=Lacticaseibacillus suilingensis TaxID=2799577 RepID=UPI0022E87108|nr:DUF1642 domain-containing protein [Lacticaseibacillus suilingensis]